MALEFVFRVDSSSKMGAGHVMRCLTLAQRISRMGGNCTFVCRDHAGNISEKIRSAGFNAKVLPAADNPSDCSWLGADVQKDASEFISALDGISPDWIVLDHYGIDKEWEANVSGNFPGTGILVIDDLADRKHVCDFLLDLSPGRNAVDYDGFVDGDTKLLIGLDYALLRPEYSRLRSEMGVPKLKISSQPRIFVTFGGGDHSAILQETLVALAVVAERFKFDVLVQGDLSNLSIPEVLLERTTHSVFLPDMASEIASSDLMICAAGGTSWERCSLGKPAVVLTIAENQKLNAEAIAKAGAGICVANRSEEISAALEKLLSDPDLFSDISQNSWKLCDGGGANRVCNLIFSAKMTLIPATIEDARFVYDARYSADAADYYKNPEVPVFDNHEKWMRQALENDLYFLACVLLNGEKIAHVRYDYDVEDPTRAEIGIALAEKCRGKGLAAAILLSAINNSKELGISRFDAEIHEENIASISAFEQAGFERANGPSTQFFHYEIDLKE